MPADHIWDGFFVFGVPLHGMMCFAIGGIVAVLLGSNKEKGNDFIVQCIRSQMMPIYVVHAIVIVVCGWAAKAIGCYASLETIQGDVAMWFVGVIGAIAIGEAMRRWTPNAAEVLFGGR